jgi:hypothetical protein
VRRLCSQIKKLQKLPFGFSISTAIIEFFIPNHASKFIPSTQTEPGEDFIAVGGNNW